MSPVPKQSCRPSRDGLSPGGIFGRRRAQRSKEREEGQYRESNRDDLSWKSPVPQEPNADNLSKNDRCRNLSNTILYDMEACSCTGGALTGRHVARRYKVRSTLIGPAIVFSRMIGVSAPRNPYALKSTRVGGTARSFDFAKGRLPVAPGFPRERWSVTA